MKQVFEMKQVLLFLSVFLAKGTKAPAALNIMNPIYFGTELVFFLRDFLYLHEIMHPHLKFENVFRIQRKNMFLCVSGPGG